MATAHEFKNALASFNTPQSIVNYDTPKPTQQTFAPEIKDESPLTGVESFLWAGMRSPEAKRAFLAKKFGEENVVPPELSPVGDFAIKTPSGKYFPIDPKGFGKGGIKEFGRDIAESVPDVLLGGLTTAGQALGTVGGTLAMPFTAGVANPITGEIAGGGLAGRYGEMGFQKLARKASGLSENEAPISKGDINIATGTGMIPLGGITKALSKAPVLGKVMKFLGGKSDDVAKGGFTRTEALAKGTGMPDHVAQEALEQAQNGVDFLPPKHKSAGELFYKADKDMMHSYDVIEKDFKNKFSAELKNVKTVDHPNGITDSSKFNIDSMKKEIKVMYKELKAEGADKKTLDLLKKKEITYGDIKKRKDELTYQFKQILKHGGEYKELNAAKKSLDALRSIEDSVVPGIKELKVKYARGYKALETIENVNRNVAKEGRESITTGLDVEELTGMNRLSRLGNENTNLGNYSSLKEVSNYMKQEGLEKDDFWKSLNQSLLRHAEEKDKTKGAVEAVTSISPMNISLKTAGDVLKGLNPIGSPKKKLRFETHALKILSKIPGIGKASGKFMQSEANPWIAGNINQTLAALLPKLGIDSNVAKSLTTAELRNLLSKAVNR